MDVIATSALALIGAAAWLAVNDPRGYWRSFWLLNRISIPIGLIGLGLVIGAGLAKRAPGSLPTLKATVISVNSLLIVFELAMLVIYFVTRPDPGE